MVLVKNMTTLATFLKCVIDAVNDFKGNILPYKRGLICQQVACYIAVIYRKPNHFYPFSDEHLSSISG